MSTAPGRSPWASVTLWETKRGRWPLALVGPALAVAVASAIRLLLWQVGDEAAWMYWIVIVTIGFFVVAGAVALAVVVRRGRGALWRSAASVPEHTTTGGGRPAPSRYLSACLALHADRLELIGSNWRETFAAVEIERIEQRPLGFSWKLVVELRSGAHVDIYSGRRSLFAAIRRLTAAT